MSRPDALDGVDTIPAALRRAELAWPDRIAVVDGARRVSYQALAESVRTFAHGLRDLGVGRGHRVAIWMPNGLDWIVSALASLHLGAAIVPMNTRYRGAEVADLVRRSRPTVVVVADGFLGRSQLVELRGAPAALAPVGDLGEPALVVLGASTAPGGRVHAFADLMNVAGRADQGAVARNDDPADILYTSGTTGVPKGAVSTQEQTVAAARRWAEIAGLRQSDTYLLVNPLFHSYGYKAGLIASLLTGTTIVPVATFDPEEAVRLVADLPVTVLPGPPTIFTSIMALRPPAGALASLRLVVTGAAIVPEGLVDTLLDEVGVDTVLTAYGMTECPVITMCRPDEPRHVASASSGAPIADIDLRVADSETGAALPPGAAGEVQVRGPIVIREYLDDPVATAAAFTPDGWFRTGDIGRLGPDGHLAITDRLKDVIISGGFNVYPAEIERHLWNLGGVAEAAVVGVPDQRLGEVAVAFVVPREGSRLDPDAILETLRSSVANFKVPRQVRVLDALPRNALGKVEKVALRAVATAGISAR